MKTKVIIDGEEIEMDLDEDEINEQKVISKDPKRKAVKKIKAIIPLACVMGFLLCGFLIPGGWAWSWSILILIPFLESVLAVEKQQTRRIVASIASLLVVGAVFFFGFYFHQWRWIWVLFFLIPIIHILAE